MVLTQYRYAYDLQDGGTVQSERGQEDLHDPVNGGIWLCSDLERDGFCQVILAQNMLQEDPAYPQPN